MQTTDGRCMADPPSGSCPNALANPFACVRIHTYSAKHPFCLRPWCCHGRSTVALSPRIASPILPPVRQPPATHVHWPAIVPPQRISVPPGIPGVFISNRHSQGTMRANPVEGTVTFTMTEQSYAAKVRCRLAYRSTHRSFCTLAPLLRATPWDLRYPILARLREH